MGLLEVRSLCFGVLMGLGVVDVEGHGDVGIVAEVG